MIKNIKDFCTEDWNELVDKINDKYCIVLIGTNFYKDQNNNVLHELLYEKLKDKFNKNILEIFSEDGFFVPTDEHIINDMRRIVKKFYSQEIVNEETLKKVAQIPFHCIINFTPDLLLTKIFTKYDVRHSFESFSMTKPFNNQSD
jgi:TRAP-type mannitol/chloroaromatic compound transport system permease small subunit